MKKRTILLIILIPLAALGFWSYFKKTEPPVVPFAKARRETLVSTLITNGKVEPLEFVAVRVDTAGLVVKLPIKEGLAVSGFPLQKQNRHSFAHCRGTICSKLKPKSSASSRSMFSSQSSPVFLRTSIVSSVSPDDWKRKSR